MKPTIGRKVSAIMRPPHFGSHRPTKIILTRIMLATAAAMTLTPTGLTGCTHSDSPTEATTPSSSEHDMLLHAAKCLRDHGLSVKDPAPGEGIQMPNTDQKKSEAAFKACRKYLPAQSSDDAQQERKQMLTYAKCMRDHGVEKFADPKPGKGIDLTPAIANDPDYKSADATCQKQMGTSQQKSTNG